MASPQLENGYIKIANEITKEFSQAKNRISGEEWCVLWVILNKTYGWNKKEDIIALSQFYQETGMKKPSIIRALNKLLLRNIVSKRANEKSNFWLINKDFDKWKPLAKKLIVSRTANGVSKTANKSLAKQLPTQYNQDTIAKNTPPQELKELIVSVIPLKDVDSESNKKALKRLWTASGKNMEKITALLKAKQFFDNSEYPYVIYSVQSLYEKKDKIFARYEVAIKKQNL